MVKLKLKDLVKVTAGKDRGRTGKVLKIFPQIQRVLVAGVNLYTRHLKPRADKAKTGGKIRRERPLPFANVALVCPKCNLPTRVGLRLSEGKKERICRKCRVVLP